MKEYIDLDNQKINPIISIITPFLNAEEFIEETAKSVLNQTFPFFEWIIVDDGSGKNGKEKLKEIEGLDKRIKIFSREEKIEKSGPAIARDIGIKKASKFSKYIVFLDADDLYDKTFLECAYWTLETHEEASWTYSDSINFGTKNFLWRKYYNVEWEKNENILTVSACVRKKDLEEIGLFGIEERRIYEDWYLWLKLIKNGKYPVRMNSLLTYYRQKKDNSELKKANSNNRKNALKLIEQTSAEIMEYKDGIQFPKFDYNFEEIIEENENIPLFRIKEDDKINILMIIPWMVTGGADKFNLSLISRLDKGKFKITIITTLPSKNEWRKEFEKYATVYDLTTFLNMNDWLSFINYIIYKENINMIFNSNSEFGYKILPYLKAKYPEIPIIDYVHMEEWYWRNGGFSRDSSIVSNVIDKTFTCNDNSRNIFINHFGRKEDEIKTVYVGVDEEHFKPDKRQRDNKFKIGFVSRIVDQKRPFLFFEVCKKLLENRKDFKVIVAGEGPYLDELKYKVKKEKIEKIFEFLGNVSDTKSVYKMCDLTVNTSIKEGIALSSYESLSMGVPVVSSDVGGQKELITSDVGIVVPCLQHEKEILNFNYSEEEINGYVIAINKVLDNLNFYMSNCRRRIEKDFSIDKMVKNMEEEFLNVHLNPKEEKIKNGKELSKNISILKELISYFFMASKQDYQYLANKFNKENVHINEIYNYNQNNIKKGIKINKRNLKKKNKILCYEKTLEYKIKHPIVVALRKIGVYERLKKMLRFGVNNT